MVLFVAAQVTRAGTACAIVCHVVAGIRESELHIGRWRRVWVVMRKRSRAETIVAGIAARATVLAVLTGIWGSAVAGGADADRQWWIPLLVASLTGRWRPAPACLKIMAAQTGRAIVDRLLRMGARQQPAAPGSVRSCGAMAIMTGRRGVPVVAINDVTPIADRSGRSQRTVRRCPVDPGYAIGHSAASRCEMASETAHPGRAAPIVSTMARGALHEVSLRVNTVKDRTLLIQPVLTGRMRGYTGVTIVTSCGWKTVSTVGIMALVAGFIVGNKLTMQHGPVNPADTPGSPAPERIEMAF